MVGAYNDQINGQRRLDLLFDRRVGILLHHEYDGGTYDSGCHSSRVGLWQAQNQISVGLQFNIIVDILTPELIENETLLLF